MSILSTTATVHHSTLLPRSPSATVAAAVALLHDHEHCLRCNPHMTKFEPLATVDPAAAAAAAAALPPPELPDALAPRAVDASPAAWSRFRVTDVVHALPAGLWDSDVISEYEFLKLTDGVFVRIHSPMGIVMESTWGIAAAAGDGGDGGDAGKGLQMTEDVLISCSRLLIGLIKGKCEEGWKSIHGKILAPLET